MLGISETTEFFDSELITYINMALATLVDIGVGPENGFSIDGPDNTWMDFCQNEKHADLIKSYVHLKVKLLFDPPSSSFVTESYNKAIAEYEWRICKDL